MWESWYLWTKETLESIQSLTGCSGGKVLTVKAVLTRPQGKARTWTRKHSSSILSMAWDFWVWLNLSCGQIFLENTVRQPSIQVWYGWLLHAALHQVYNKRTEWYKSAFLWVWWPGIWTLGPVGARAVALLEEVCYLSQALNTWSLPVYSLFVLMVKDVRSQFPAPAMLAVCCHSSSTTIDSCMPKKHLFLL